MVKTCIAVIDATRARLFTLEREDGPSGLHEDLRETRDFVNTLRRRTPHEIFTDTRPGTSRMGSRQFGFDDHRDAHVDHIDAEFARSIVDEARTVIRDAGARRLVLCASPRMLGILRPLLPSLSSDGVAIDEVARDLVKLAPARLRHHLASLGALPPAP
jgi:protein required for attachment to host cells